MNDSIFFMFWLKFLFFLIKKLPYFYLKKTLSVKWTIEVLNEGSQMRRSVKCVNSNRILVSKEKKKYHFLSFSFLYFLAPCFGNRMLTSKEKNKSQFNFVEEIQKTKLKRKKIWRFNQPETNIMVLLKSLFTTLKKEA